MFGCNLQSHPLNEDFHVPDEVCPSDRSPQAIPGNFSSVWVQCDLLEKGDQHSQACAKKSHNGDPAKRLAIRFRYRSKESGQVKEDWCKMEINSDMKKLNSLVDFLDGEDEEYTAKQPRRFLAQKKGRNRRLAMYT
ncbi:hypothetical protein EV356DRAFT_509007 [Viridothelium virens]|uniref:Uncharacterized protein n=1 Tax=Viridothelium virens TaxID=1048519 RepID=A0A6A6GXZ5_VIRVR|nr:hypothetical protein EV356DRAFT_509007 [Viridothelium virens]